MRHAINRRGACKHRETGRRSTRGGASGAPPVESPRAATEAARSEGAGTVTTPAPAAPASAPVVTSVELRIRARAPVGRVTVEHLSPVAPPIQVPACDELPCVRTVPTHAALRLGWRPRRGATRTLALMTGTDAVAVDLDGTSDGAPCGYIDPTTGLLRACF